MKSFTSLATAAGVTNIVASTLPCGLIRVQGYFKGNADAWLQIHDATALPANTAVPLKSYLLQSTFVFSWEFDPNEVELRNGLVIAISTTETTLTISTDKMDIFGELEPRSFIPEDYSTGSGTDSLEVWSEANGPLALFKVSYTNGDGDTRYLMLFTEDSPADGSTPVEVWSVASGGSLVLNFGTAGFVPKGSQKGCTLAQSSTRPTLTITSSAASTIVAAFK